MSKKKILDGVSKFLVGSEKVAPEVQKAISSYVTPTGRLVEESLQKRRLLGNLLIGKKGTMEALKGRYQQGGLLGPGGLVRGELALDPRYKELLKNIKNRDSSGMVLDPYTGKLVSGKRAITKGVTKGVGQSINPLFLLGFPIADIKSSLETDSSDIQGGSSGVLGAIGSGLGFAAAAPLGLVGGIGASMLGETLGQNIGSVIDPSPKTIDIFGGQKGTRLPRASDLILDAAIPQ